MSYDAVPPEVYQHATPKARKPYKCGECRGVIEAGETYHKHSGLWDGNWATFRVCNECEALRNEINADLHYYDQVALEEMEEALEYDRPAELIKRYKDNAERRGGHVPSWMKEDS